MPAQREQRLVGERERLPPAFVGFQRRRLDKPFVGEVGGQRPAPQAIRRFEPVERVGVIAALEGLAPLEDCTNTAILRFRKFPMSLMLGSNASAIAHTSAS